MIGALPESLVVGDTEYPIRSDYRCILGIFDVFNDKELQGVEPWIVAIYLLFEDFRCAEDVLAGVDDGFDIKEAIRQMNWFISAGKPEKKNLEKPTYNWAQDEQMIFSAVNKVAGCETREMEYLHWWTFLGYFNEIEEGTFSFVSGIRHKLNHGKKLEKHEKEFLTKNREIVEIKPNKTEEERKQEEEYQTLIDEVLG